MAKTGKASKVALVVDDRVKEYPEIKTELHLGEDAITADLCKRLLGWEVAAPGEDTYLFKDEEGNGVRLTKNASNRPFSLKLAQEYAQDILNHKWFFNGQSISIGEYGNAISFQHRGVALVLASQLWDGDNRKHWIKLWPNEPTIEGIIVYGVPEDREVINTLDAGRIRTFADNLYGDPKMFPGMKVAERIQLCKVVDNCIKIIWHRTGAKKDAYSPTRTHSEALTFLENHPRIKDCVKEVFLANKADKDADGKKLMEKLTRYVPLTWAAAMMYLMGVSETDGDKYRKTGNRTEKRCDLSNWDRAEEFWTMLAGSAAEMKPLHNAILNLRSEDGEGPGTSTAEKVGIICKAWTSFLAKKPIDEKRLKLRFTLNDNGRKILEETPDVNGIDLGNPDADEDDEIVPTDLGDETEVSETELEAMGSDLMSEEDNEVLGADEEDYTDGMASGNGSEESESIDSEESEEVTDSEDGDSEKPNEEELEERKAKARDARKQKKIKRKA